MLPNGYERNNTKRKKSVDVVKRELQYDIIEHWQVKVAKMNESELRLYIKMNNVKTF